METMNRKRCLVFGSRGQMGKAIVYAMNKLGYEVDGFDMPEWDAQDHYDIEEKIFVRFHPDFVISALPYYLNERVAKQCLENNIPYFDLGGNKEISDKINKMAKDTGTLCMTDLGLAPGWVNIIAEYGYQKFLLMGIVPADIKMMVGGIPQEQKDMWGYNVFWSVDGLLNEYRGSCEVIEDGQAVLKPALSGLQSVGRDHEAFYTSGGMAYTTGKMLDRGIKNCCYKTIRYKGHRNILKRKMEDKIYQDDDLLKGFFNFMTRDEPNQIIIKCIVKHKHTNEKLIFVYDKVIKDTPEFNSMQIATAFPAAAAAHTLYRDKSSNFLKWTTGYSRICYARFNESLSALDKSLV